MQHAWFDFFKFKESTWQDAADKRDNILRIAFLSTQKSHSGIGHVAIVWNGRTIESHGSTGPDFRAFGSQPWATETNVYVLSLE
jgi:hypothetical protein